MWYGMHGMGWPMMGFGWIFGGLFVILFVALIVLLIVRLARGSRHYCKHMHHEHYGHHGYYEDPLEILKHRYAKGEITKEQYENMKKDLS